MTSIPIDTIEIPSSLVNYTAKKEYIVNTGANQINFNSLPFNAPTFGSTAVQVQVPAGQALLRNAFLNVNGIVNYTCSSNVGVNGQQPDVPGPDCKIGFSANPYWSIMNNLQITIANITTSYNSIRDCIDILTRVKRSITVAYDSYSGDAVLHDNCTRFPQNMEGSTNMDVLGSYYTQGFGEFVQPRTMFLRIIPTQVPNAIQNNQYNNVPFQLAYNLNIPLFWGIFVGGDNDDLAIPRVNNLLINISTQNNPNDMFNCYFGPGNNAVTQINYVGFVQPNISINYRTIQIDESVTPLSTFNSFLTYYQTNTQGVVTPAPYTSTTIQIPQISFSTTPSLIMLAVRPVFANRTATANMPFKGPQFYYPISGCNLNFGKNNVLNIPLTANISDYWCYQLARKNGLEMNFAEYSGQSTSNLYGTGASLLTGSNNGLSGGFMIVTSRDLQYTSDVTMAPGTIPTGNQLVLSGTLQYYSTTPGQGLQVELVVLAILPQLFNEVSPGGYELRAYNPSEGTITKLDSVLTDARDLEQRAASYGGGFFSNLKSAAKKALDLSVKNSDKIFNAAKSVLPTKYSNAIDKIEKYSDKLKNLYEKSGSGIGQQNYKQQQLIEIVMQMEEEGVPEHEIEALVEKYTARDAPRDDTRDTHDNIGAGVQVDRKSLIDNSSKTIKSRLLQFL